MFNNKGVSTVIASTIMIGITIALMFVVMSYSQDSINVYHDQMGEGLQIENVFISNTTITIYARNIGHGILEIQFVRINGEAYNLTEGKVNLLESEGKYLTIEDSFERGIYTIELISSRWNEWEFTEEY